ncbi:MAG: hypothetical protein CV089_14005 [Nitrospira sp. WS110]|nr:hypothetical protein [Nitrospira sp. WS110]
MEWGELALGVLLITALVAQLVRVWTQREFEPKKEEAVLEVDIPSQKSKRVPIQEPRGRNERSGQARPARDAFTARRLPTFRIDTHARNMRRGVILMTILEPCRGVNPFVFRD